MSNGALRRFLDYVLLLLAVATAGYAVWELRQPWAPHYAGSWLWWSLVAAGLVGGVALRRMEGWLPDLQPEARPVDPAARLRLILGLLCFACGLGLAAWVVIALWPNYYRWHGKQWMWLGALLFTFAGGWLVRAVGEAAAGEVPGGRCRRADGQRPTRGISLALEVGVFLAITALAVFLRVHRLDEIPAGIYVDETNAAMDALYVLEGREDSPFATSWYETPTGYIYYMAGLFKLFGASHGSLKAASLIPAILTVMAIYPLGRQLFGPATAMAAMFVLAVSRWHLTMSRWGWNEVAPPLFQVLATFFLIRGLRERRASDFALGGIICGLTLYTYLSSRMVIATLGLFGVYWLVAASDGPVAAWKRHWKGLVLFLLAALIAMAPIGVTYLRRPFTFMNRITEISVFNEVRALNSYQPLLDNLVRHLKFFHRSGDMSGKHNLPGEPHTDPVTGVLFVVGLGYALVRLRDRRRGLLWIWLVLGMAGGIFSVRHEAPQAYRTLTAVPAIALLAGDVLMRLAQGLAGPRAGTAAGASWQRAMGRMAGGVLVLGALGAVGAWEVSVYFGRQADSVQVQAGFNLTENAVAKEMVAALQSDTKVYLSPRFSTFSPLRYLVYGVVKQQTGRSSLEDPPYSLLRLEIDLPVPDAGGDALFLLDTYYWSVMDHLRFFYPGADITLVRGPGDLLLYVRARVSGLELAAIQGLTARFTDRSGKLTEHAVSQLDEIWDQRDVVAAEWLGSVRVDHSGVYDFTTHGDLNLVVDGQPWTGRRFLARGMHSLAVTQERSDQHGVARLGWASSRGSADVVPAEALFRSTPVRQGLTARYFANTDWQGDPVFSQVTPFILLAWGEGQPEPFWGPFSVRLTGSLHVENPGDTLFRIDADDGARLFIDGRLLGEGMIPDQPNRILARAELGAGYYPIQIDYVQRGGGNALEFYWAPPGKPLLPVPPSVLFPEAH